MSNNVLPALPGFSRELGRTPEYNTEEFETMSGAEQSVSWWSTPRYRYRCRWNGLRTGVMAPAPWAAYTEPDVLLLFYLDHRGQWDSFLWVDPYTNTQVRVKFVKGSLSITRILGSTGGAQLWLATAELYTPK